MRTRHTAFYVSVYRSSPVQVKVSTRHLFVFRRNSIIIIIELFPPLVADITKFIAEIPIEKVIMFVHYSCMQKLPILFVSLKEK